MAAEKVLETFVNDTVTQQEATNQLIYDVLVEPAKQHKLPRTLVDRVAMETPDEALCP